MASRKNASATGDGKEPYDLKAKRVWAALPGDNPFETPAQALVAEVKQDTKGVLWVKFSTYRPDLAGGQPFEYVEEGEFRDRFPRLVSPL